MSDMHREEHSHSAQARIPASLESRLWRAARWRPRGFLRWCALGLCLLTLTELLARFAIGLGDPPLTIRDPRIDYMFAPSRCYSRFHHRVCYNRWSMRAGAFAAHKSECEPRVMVFGDSIVNGGVMIDQDDIATEILRRRLAASALVTTVGNISAGSWGPANVLAYVEHFGWFDADVGVFVFNAGDIEDLPDFSPDLGPDFPTRTPWSALGELFGRYVPRYLPHPGVPSAVHTPNTNSARRSLGIAAIEHLLARARENVPHVVVVFHPDRTQLTHASPEETLFRQLGERTGARFVTFRDHAKGAFYDDDGLHLNALGQAALGRLLSDTVRPMLTACAPF